MPSPANKYEIIRSRKKSNTGGSGAWSAPGSVIGECSVRLPAYIPTARILSQALCAKFPNPFGLTAYRSIDEVGGNDTIESFFHSLFRITSLLENSKSFHCGNGDDAQIFLLGI